jgi:Tfp pilus assembly protein PilO
MNRNATPLILIILAIGIFFTFTNPQIGELKQTQAINDGYLVAINNSKTLIQKRDAVLNDYNKLDDTQKQNLNKMLPNNIDNVRLIIDVNAIAQKHNLSVKSIHTSAVSGGAAASAPTPQSGQPRTGTQSSSELAGYNTMSLSLSASATYQNFLDFLNDVQASLRIMDISHLVVTANETGTYDYSVDIKTYWMKQ